MEAHLTPERLVTFLLDTPMFDNLDPSEIRQILHIVEPRSLKAGEVVFREGDDGDAWYVLYQGGAEVLKQSADGEDVIARRMRDAVSEMSHYDEYDYIIINDQFEKALQDLHCVLHAQHLTRGQQGGLVSTIR